MGMLDTQIGELRQRVDALAAQVNAVGPAVSAVVAELVAEAVASLRDFRVRLERLEAMHGGAPAELAGVRGAAESQPAPVSLVTDGGAEVA